MFVCECVAPFIMASLFYKISNFHWKFNWFMLLMLLFLYIHPIFIPCHRLLFVYDVFLFFSYSTSYTIPWGIFVCVCVWCIFCCCCCCLFVCYFLLFSNIIKVTSVSSFFLINQEITIAFLIFFCSFPQTQCATCHSLILIMLFVLYDFNSILIRFSHFHLVTTQHTAQAHTIHYKLLISFLLFIEFNKVLFDLLDD